MARIIVAGLINVETTLRIDEFPLHYQPQNFPFFGIRATVSGVGYNVARALTTLGHDVALLSLIGEDLTANLVRTTLAGDGISDGRRPAGDAADARSRSFSTTAPASVRSLPT